MLLQYVVLLAVKFLWLDWEWCCSGAVLRIPVCISIFTHTPVCVESPRKDRPGKMAFCLNRVRIRYLGRHLLPCICCNKLPPNFIQLAELSVPPVQCCLEQGAGHCLFPQGRDCALLMDSLGLGVSGTVSKSGHASLILFKKQIF